MDVPYWPQLPHYNYYEDMYVQASEHFPGIVVDIEQRTLRFSMEKFFSLAERPRGVHLCGNPDWDFLLKLDLDVLSLDVYANGEAFTAYAPSIKKFLNKGGIIVWGIVPTNVEPFEKDNIENLTKRLESLWDRLAGKGLDRELLITNGMLSPATCCLVNPDVEKTVEKAFSVVNQMSQILREKHHMLL